MTKILMFVAAIFMTTIAVSSACIATPAGSVQFTIAPSRTSDQVQLRFERNRDGGRHMWDSSFRLAELQGLDRSALDGSSTRPLRFALVREAGRLDCAGTAGNRMARGTCTVSADPSFNRYLRERGIRTPSDDETFGLISLGVKRELVTALSQARYPTPTVSDLMELTAIGVTPNYIQGLAGQGYRPKTLDALVEFGALDITPEYIGSFVRAGYGDISADELVQLKALDITADYVRGFDRIGYGRLPVDTLVQLKALDVTPEFVRAVQQGSTLPSPDRLVILRALGSEISKR